MHLQGNLRSLLIPAKVTLADQEPQHEAGFERVNPRASDVLFHVLHIGETHNASFRFTAM
jgi:hypothetical protein